MNQLENSNRSQKVVGNFRTQLAGIKHSDLLPGTWATRIAPLSLPRRLSDASADFQPAYALEETAGMQAMLHANDNER
jgi:hypothetical protein